MKAHRHSKTLVVTILMCLLLTAAFYPFRLPVHEQIEGVMLDSDDKTLCQPVSLSIEGSYLWSAFGPDSLDISHFEVKGFVSSRALQKEDATGALFILDAAGNKTLVSGTIHCSPLNTQLELSFPPSSEQDSIRLVFPAASREDALALLARYDSNFHTTITSE